MPNVRVGRPVLEESNNFQIKKFPESLKEHLYNVLRLCHCRVDTKANERKAMSYLNAFSRGKPQDPIIDMILEECKSAYLNRKGDEFLAYDHPNMEDDDDE